MPDLTAAQARWPDEATARTYLEALRWQGKPVCPYCASPQISRHHEAQRRGRWQCQSCRRSFSVTIGTPLQHSHVELTRWLWLLHLQQSAPPLSSRQLAGLLDVQQRSVLAMQARLRDAAPSPFWRRLQRDLAALTDPPRKAQGSTP